MRALHVIFRGVAQSRSTKLTAAAALRKAKGISRGRGFVWQADKGLTFASLNVLDIRYLGMLSGTENS